MTTLPAVVWLSEGQIKYEVRQNQQRLLRCYSRVEVTQRDSSGCVYVCAYVFLCVCVCICVCMLEVALLCQGWSVVSVGVVEVNLTEDQKKLPMVDVENIEHS